MEQGIFSKNEQGHANKWLTAKDAAKYMRTSAGAIRNMVYRGQLPAYKPNGKLFFKRSELDRLIESSKLGG